MRTKTDVWEARKYHAARDGVWLLMPSEYGLPSEYGPHLRGRWYCTGVCANPDGIHEELCWGLFTGSSNRLSGAHILCAECFFRMFAT